jgi:RNA polymerase sigma-70 factor (ECF subfamily)
MTAMSNLLELSVPRRRAPVRRPGRGRITENRVIRSAARRRIGGVQTVGIRRVVRRRAVRHGPACGGRGSGTVRAVESSGSLLAARLAAGDDRALAEAFDEFGPAVHAVARQVLGNAAAAQDVVQEVFVELWCHPQRYDETLGTLRTYLTLVARHRAQDAVRSELRRSAREERHVRMVPPPPRPSPEEEVADADTASTVRDAVRSLPDDQRRAVELAYFDGLSYRDVARRIGIPEGTAKSRVRLALAKLETMLGHELLEPS